MQIYQLTISLFIIALISYVTLFFLVKQVFCLNIQIWRYLKSTAINVKRHKQVTIINFDIVKEEYGHLLEQ